jgi:hypothetical protein
VERDGAHPVIEIGTPEFKLWCQYFDNHLGGRPAVFKMLIDNKISCMTVPEPVPMWFDPTFDPSAPAPRKPPQPFPIMAPRYNVLVRPNRPRYAEMVERSRSSDPRDYLIDHAGIWIPEAWWHEGRR